MNNRTEMARAVVERPDHCCGVDLVLQDKNNMSLATRIKQSEALEQTPIFKTVNFWKSAGGDYREITTTLKWHPHISAIGGRPEVPHHVLPVTVCEYYQAKLKASSSSTSREIT